MEFLDPLQLVIDGPSVVLRSPQDPYSCLSKVPSGFRESEGSLTAVCRRFPAVLGSPRDPLQLFVEGSQRFQGVPGIPYSCLQKVPSGFRTSQGSLTVVCRRSPVVLGRPKDPLQLFVEGPQWFQDVPRIPYSCLQKVPSAFRTSQGSLTVVCRRSPVVLGESQGSLTVVCRRSPVVLGSPRDPLQLFVEGPQWFQGVPGIPYSCLQKVPSGFRESQGSLTVVCRRSPVVLGSSRDPLQLFVEGSQRFQGVPGIPYSCLQKVPSGFRESQGSLTVVCRRFPAVLGSPRDPLQLFVEGPQWFQGVPGIPYSCLQKVPSRFKGVPGIPYSCLQKVPSGFRTSQGSLTVVCRRSPVVLGSSKDPLQLFVEGPQWFQGVPRIPYSCLQKVPSGFRESQGSLTVVCRRSPVVLGSLRDPLQLFVEGPQWFQGVPGIPYSCLQKVPQWFQGVPGIPYSCLQKVPSGFRESQGSLTVVCRRSPVVLGRPRDPLQLFVEGPQWFQGVPGIPYSCLQKVPSGFRESQGSLTVVCRRFPVVLGSPRDPLQLFVEGPQWFQGVPRIPYSCLQKVPSGFRESQGSLTVVCRRSPVVLGSSRDPLQLFVEGPQWFQAVPRILTVVCRRSQVVLGSPRDPLQLFVEGPQWFQGVPGIPYSCLQKVPSGFRESQGSLTVVCRRSPVVLGSSRDPLQLFVEGPQWFQGVPGIPYSCLQKVPSGFRTSQGSLTVVCRRSPVVLGSSRDPLQLFVEGPQWFQDVPGIPYSCLQKVPSGFRTSQGSLTVVCRRSPVVLGRPQGSLSSCLQKVPSGFREFQGSLTVVCRRSPVVLGRPRDPLQLFVEGPQWFQGVPGIPYSCLQKVPSGFWTSQGSLTVVCRRSPVVLGSSRDPLQLFVEGPQWFQGVPGIPYSCLQKVPSGFRTSQGSLTVVCRRSPVVLGRPRDPLQLFVEGPQWFQGVPRILTAVCRRFPVVLGSSRDPLQLFVEGPQWFQDVPRIPQAWFPYSCICRFCLIKKIFTTDTTIWKPHTQPPNTTDTTHTTCCLRQK